MTRPLYDEQAELAVLGAAMVRQEALDDVADVLDPHHFGRRHHQRVFAAMRHLHAAGQPLDPVTLCAHLTQAGHMEDVTKSFVYELGNGVPRTANVLAYASVIRDKALLRSLRDIGARLQTQAESALAKGVLLLEEAEQAIFGLSATSVKSDWVSGAELAAELYPVIEQLTKQRTALTGVASGFRDLDRLTRGFQPGDLILLGGRPSEGKTALGLQVAMNAAAAVPVAFFSIEMGRQPIGLRGVASAAQVDGWRLLSGRLSESDLHRVGDGLATVGNASIFLDESPTLSPVHVRSKLRRLQSRAGRLGLVVIDYLQLMAPLGEHRHETKNNQVAGISRALKVLAREFGAPFLVLSQLSRGVEKSKKKRPTMADLRDSGALEQDADVVLLLHRPASAADGVTELIMAKHRNGPTGTVEMTWQKEQMRFENRGVE